MGPTTRQILFCLLIGFFIGGLYANRSTEHAAKCESDKDCLKGQDKCIQRECHCIYKDAKMCEKCHSDADCKYGQCFIPGTCDCGLGQIKDGRICNPAPPHPCKRNGDCDTYKDAGRCHGGKCRCEGKMTGNGRWCREALPCPPEYEEKCKAAGSGVERCVVDPYWKDKPFCKCRVGFNTTEAGICLEMTECEKNGLECPTGEICKQGNGTYGCACPDGYEKIRADGNSAIGNRTCQDIDECKQKVCSAIANFVCVNMAGSYKCECKEGFKKNADGSACEGICNCGENQVCEEGICKCSSGFIKNSDGKCEDLDECSQNEKVCSGAKEECVNEQGKYSCECQSGYERKNEVCVKKACNCKRHEECHEGKCKCKKGYKKSKKGHCVHRGSSLQASSGHSVSSYLSSLLFGVIGSLSGLQAASGHSLHVSGYLSALILGVIGSLAITV
ncbi:hypothetical protein ACROYT_G023875 [Oculina patagonica]